MVQPRRYEPTTSARIGFMSEATSFTAEIFDDLDSPPGKTNFYLQNRVKEYFSILDAVIVNNGGTPIVNSGLTAYTLQRLGGFVRFSQPQTLTQTNDVQTIAWTTPAGTIQLQLTDKNGVVWTTPTIASAATAANVITAIAAATPSVANPGYANPFSGSALVAGGGPFGTTPITLTGGGSLAGQFIPTYVVLTTGVTGGTPAVTHTTPGASGITASGKYVPMYPILGGRNHSNADESQEIDLTGSGDAIMFSAPGRPKIHGSFDYVTGQKVTNAAGKVVSIESMMRTEKRNNSQIVLEIVDDTTDPTLPRECFFAYIGNFSKQRPLNGALTRQTTWYVCACPDSASDTLIDYVA